MCVLNGYEIFLAMRENGLQRVEQENFTMKITPVYTLDKSIFGVYTDRSNELTNTPSMMEERRTIMTNNNRNVKFMITMGVQVVRGESSQQ